ncbi:MAG: hypothetical protein ACRD6W_05130, partial [Nitrososphaerales archaeon]
LYRLREIVRHDGYLRSISKQRLGWVTPFVSITPGVLIRRGTREAICSTVFYRKRSVDWSSVRGSKCGDEFSVDDTEATKMR